ncbi:MAG: sn-glycerol-1-phosphate dehydrogenase [Treponema sp.]|jgi:glycerol-1-phosphate dehydrogenase [NAD(P)+]|nr:sn-glycerol-1-phosphate dehydrogenase [Treponema sp.]
MNGKKYIPSLAECLAAADETKALRVQKNCFNTIPEILKEFFSFSSVFLIADGNTWDAAGKAVETVLLDNGIAVAGKYIFPAEPRLHAEYYHIKALVEALGAVPSFKETVPIAIGAGTVNDLSKRAAFEKELPYLCVPTAASVDGYTAFGAAILMDGFKQTLPCTAPRCLAADTDVLAGAPAYLSSSGFGDLASKIIAGTDWIISDYAGKAGAAGADPINQKAWDMTQNGLMDYLERSVGAAKGDGDAVNALFEALGITGLSMQLLKTSRSVSGSEHLFSHVWEMEDLSMNGVPVTHGHKVTIGTLAATAFTEIFFADPEGPPPAHKDFRLPAGSERMAEVSGAFKNSRAHDGVVKIALEKLPGEKNARVINDAFRSNWKEIRERILEQLVPYSELKKLLAGAGCPLIPEEINLSRNYTIATARRAQMMRNKYGILDLAWVTGAFETILSRMEESEIYLR